MSQMHFGYCYDVVACSTNEGQVRHFRNTKSMNWKPSMNEGYSLEYSSCLIQVQEHIHGHPLCSYIIAWQLAPLGSQRKLQQSHAISISHSLLNNHFEEFAIPLPSVQDVSFTDPVKIIVVKPNSCQIPQL